MLNCQKEKFNIQDDVSYINVASISPNLKSVEAAGIEAILKKSKPWNIQRDDFFSPVEKVKKSFAQLINCKEPQRIALIPSVSYGFANVIKNIKATSKNNIVLADEGFPSNYYAWKRMANETGAQIKNISPPKDSSFKGNIWNQAIINAIDENTIAVSLGNVHWTDGTLFNLIKIRAKAHENNASLIIDIWSTAFIKNGYGQTQSTVPSK